MQLELKNNTDLFGDFSIEPLREIAAYEALWKERSTSFKTIAEIFAKHPGSKPSAFVESSDISMFMEYLKPILSELKETNKSVNLIFNSTLEYPSKLRDAKYPIEIFYSIGNLELISTRSVAIVGTRKPSHEGQIRTRNLVKKLVEKDFTIVSGLAAGIDTAAHTSAISEGGRTIAVIGTPLNECYPKANKALQDEIAKNHLLISQIPFYRYNNQDFRVNRFFFPERNKTMSALTEATVIVEASDTSGTLIQARAALHQKRKLFILDSCFKNPDITWPKRFEEKGAIRVKVMDDILKALG